MPRDTLTGSRIRERRVLRGMKQADLARDAGISASYLNLIEHNRRRIGGKLLLTLAEILEVEPAALTEGAGAALIASLREAAADMPEVGAELDRVDEFAGRFPGWAQLLADSRTRMAQLERSLETLNDRMTHDPHLAASLHEMLSTVTAIRSAASILAEPGEVDAEWQARFHRNIYEDSARLAETSRGLVTYLEADETSSLETGAPQEELEAALEGAGHVVPELESDGAAGVDGALTRLGKGLSGPARGLLKTWLERYATDAEALPLSVMVPQVETHGPEPAALARALGADPARIMRRLAALPADVLPTPVGLAICDSSGVLTYRKPLPDFPMPRFGAACPLWPLYRALSRPHVILSGPVMQAGRGGVVLWAEALATPLSGPAVNADPLYQAQMLVRPLPPGAEMPMTLPELGVACRVCPREACEGRREPSILASVRR
ncbi:helix-turn-helix transcriptional regulator [Mameliella sediminis]|uniref:helix-turn-helix transcriptional regulator n=1 Tax=Mameliella sediminis TaxID=2836866 RepID=UPI001C43AF13|nr:helix-turn-helix transcriptional regulator [Mameliella sediminis]MBY6117214.1 helix-turn-helix domain-containing protein [Antarctobacter heliothermus]MBY6147070.1 helix-turn-helix domain-containing protein [Mameliella alba]MBV7396607.1 helix-turn-helix domain-containing protein [Mameliella sediminis]MBY6162896.1 helix-turn-helix domain-containing protein [Mameliella alba]MBY6171160.1 helix-turn-helix domain-containing protein [Mameliella alba]